MHAYLARYGVGEPAWLDPAIAGSVFLFSVILSVIFNKLLFPLVLRFTNSTPTDLDTRIVRGIRLPLSLGIVVLGAYLAFRVPLDLSGGQQHAVNKLAGTLAIMLGVMAVSSMIASAFDWYLENVAKRTQHILDIRFLSLFRRIVAVLVYGLGTLLILDLIGVAISPLIAALGLGGLAVALAIQPTLSNLFAGTYVMTEGVISAGDYIELENGVSGYVVDVGWRSVRIRTWHNNLVVVPNSRFVETILTNYQKPVPAMNVYLTCGVSYDSDLNQVELVCLEVMDEELETNPAAVKNYGRYFGFQSFGESNVDFWLFLQAQDRLAAFELRTSLMKRLHRRFKEEGIVINYPVRTLQFPKGSDLESVRGLDLQAQAGQNVGETDEDQIAG